MNENNQRLLQVDVLRGIAAFAVFIFHVSMSVGFPKRTLPPISFFGDTWENIPSFISFGTTGVNLFFVISGFCLALQPIRRGYTSIEIGLYFRQRLTRIYPAYFIAVLFSVLVVNLRGEDWVFTDFLSKLFFLQGFFQDWHLSLNGALWSMSTEVQFYLAFPILFFIFSRCRPMQFIVVVCISTLFFRFIFASLPSADYVIGGIETGTFLMNTLLGRLLEFSLGMFLANAWLTKPEVLMRFCKIALLPALVFGAWARMSGPKWMADPALGFMCTAFVGYIVSREFRIKDDSLLVMFGRASYGFFLLHIPVILLIEYLRIIPSSFSLYQMFFAVSALSFVVTLGLSLILYFYIEKPIVYKFKKKNNYSSSKKTSPIGVTDAP